MDIVQMRRQVINLATSLAQQISAEKGIDYTAAIPEAFDEACERLDVERKRFIKLFAWSKGKINKRGIK